MKAIIDTIFNPLINWIIQTKMYLLQASVPMARPLDPSKYLGPVVYLGPVWMTLVTTVFALGFIYVVLFIVMSSQGMIIKFKNVVKWW